MCKHVMFINTEFGDRSWNVNKNRIMTADALVPDGTRVFGFVEIDAAIISSTIRIYFN